MADAQPRPSVWWVLFGFSGRIGRQSYILGQLFMLTLLVAVVARIVAVEGEENSTVFWGLAYLALGAATVLSMVATAAKRLHDLGLPGFFAVFVLVPLIDVGLILLLAIMPSSARTNAYGPPPFEPSGEKAGRGGFGR